MWACKITGGSIYNSHSTIGNEHGRVWLRISTFKMDFYHTIDHRVRLGSGGAWDIDHGSLDNFVCTGRIDLCASSTCVYPDRSNLFTSQKFCIH